MNQVTLSSSRSLRAKDTGEIQFIAQPFFSLPYPICAHITSIILRCTTCCRWTGKAGFFLNITLWKTYFDIKTLISNAGRIEAGLSLYINQSFALLFENGFHSISPTGLQFTAIFLSQYTEC